MPFKVEDFRKKHALILGFFSNDKLTLKEKLDALKKLNSEFERDWHDSTGSLIAPISPQRQSNSLIEIEAKKQEEIDLEYVLIDRPSTHPKFNAMEAIFLSIADDKNLHAHLRAKEAHTIFFYTI